MKKDLAQAAELYENALNRLGDDKNDNRERVLPLFYKAAKMGDGKAAYECGKYAIQGFSDMGKAKARQFFYLMGEVDEKALKKLEKKFYKEAVKWFKLSVKLGCPEGLAMQGYFYHYGLGPVRKNEDKAFEIYNQAKEQGSIEALTGLGVCYVTAKGTKRNSKKGLELLFEAREKGSLEAVYQLSRFYKIGLGFEEKDEEKAFNLALEAANMGHPAATFAVGKHYLEGAGVKKNVKTALKWIEKARRDYCYFKQMTEDEFLEIDDNFTTRCNKSFELAKKYEKENDDIRAIEQYRIAAEHGAYEDKYYLGRLLHTTSTELHCDKEAMVYLCEVAENSDNFGTKAAILVQEIISKYAPDPAIFASPLGSLSAENLYKNLVFLCNSIREFMPDEDKPRRLEPCTNENAQRLYEIARKTESRGEHFDLAIEGYRQAAELGHHDALFRCLQLSKRTGDISTELECKELFKTRTHPRYPFHLPSLLMLAQEVDVEALTELGNHFTFSYFRNADIAKCFYTIAAQMYALRAVNHNDAEAAYYLEKSLNKYLFVTDRRDWTKTEGYYNYGFVYYDMAVGCGSEYTKENVELAQKAEKTGIELASRVKESYDKNRERRSQLVTEQRKLRRKALEDYIYSLDEKERSFNFLTEGKYRTEEEAFLLGARDPFISDWYQKHREKKIKNFEDSLSQEDD